MEWNIGCWSVNTVTPFLCESSGDSEEVKLDVHHEEDELGVMNEYDRVSFRFYDDDDVDVDVENDDAESCSYDHSSYINTRYDDDSQHDQPRRPIYDDHEDDGNIDDDDDNEDDDKVMGSSWKKQKRSHNCCVDLLNQREIDRKFWEACLAS